MVLVVSWWKAAIIFFHYNLNVTQFYSSIILIIVIKKHHCMFIFMPIPITPCLHLVLILFSFKIVLIILLSSFDGSEWWPFNFGTLKRRWKITTLKFPLFWEAVGLLFEFEYKWCLKTRKLGINNLEVDFF